MITTIQFPHRTTVTLRLPKSAPALVLYAQGVVKRMTANPTFSTPSPTMAAITAAVDGLRAAQTAALARTTGAVAARNAKRIELVALLQQLQTYVQTVADADPANAAAIIESAGVFV